MIASTAAALLHSALASRSAKRVAARLVGERRRNALYRPFYIVQSVLSFGGLLLYFRRLPNREFWRADKTAAAGFNLARVAALGAMLSAVKQIGLQRLLGWTGVRHWRTGAAEVPAEPEAQGPALDRGRPVSGVFRFTRHPLNFLAVPLIWLAPRMTRNRLVFNLLATVYFVVGSMHEEHRLRLAYGEDYEAYRNQTAFLFGRRKGND